MTPPRAATIKVKAPVLLGLAEMVDLFPKMSKSAIYRWNTKQADRERQLPLPVAVVGATSVWTEDQVIPWAEERGLEIDRKVLERIRQEQGRK